MTFMFRMYANMFLFIETSCSQTQVYSQLSDSIGWFLLCCVPRFALPIVSWCDCDDVIVALLIVFCFSTLFCFCTS